MDMKERIRHLCKINHVSMNRVEGDLGFGKGYLSKLGTSKPNAEKLKKIADYFNVSLDFIMTGKEENEEKNQRIDIKDELERMRDLLKNRTRHPIYYDGEKLDDESLDAILAQYEMSLIYLEQKNKWRKDMNVWIIIKLNLLYTIWLKNTKPETPLGLQKN